jgi:signal transduction histidine kinase
MKMKHTGFLCGLLLQVTGLWGQYNFTQGQIDSLFQVLSSTKSDQTKIGTLFYLGLAHQYNDPKKSVHFFEESLRLSRKINDKDQVLGNLLTLGYLFSRIGEPSKSIVLLQEALIYAEAKKDDSSMALAFLANDYEAQGDFKKAIDYAIKSYQVYEARRNAKLLIDPRGYPAGPMRLGQLYEKLGQLDSAMLYAQMSYQRSIEKPLPEGTFFYCLICNLLGSLHLRYKEPEKAIVFYRSALDTAQIVSFISSIQESRLGMAKYFYQTNRLDSALHYATQAYDGAKKIKLYEVMQLSALLLRQTYEKQGNYAKALYYNDLAVAARDSVSGAEKVREVQTLTFKEEQRRQKIQQQLETQRIAYQNRVKMYSLLAVLAGVLLLAFILYRNNQQKQKANTLLETQKEEINHQKTQLQSSLETLKATQAQLIQSEKLASLGELTAGIAHEIQNPLNFVNNFAEINQELLNDLEEEIEKGNLAEIKALAEDLKSNEERIKHHGQRASAIVKNMLEHSRMSTGGRDAMHGVSTDINALADEYLRLAYHGWRAKDSRDAMHGVFTLPKMETHFDPDLPKISVVPQDIGRVLLNLINNAFYAVHQRATTVETLHATSLPHAQETLHATSLPYQPNVTISTKRLENTVEIRVQDNGSGIPEAIKDKIFQPFFTTKPTGQGTGLGLSLAYDIVIKGHGGTLDLISTEGVGSEFVIQLPLKTK